MTEFLRLRERTLGDEELERLAALAHEQRNLLSAAMVSMVTVAEGVVRSWNTFLPPAKSTISLKKLVEPSTIGGSVHATSTALGP